MYQFQIVKCYKPNSICTLLISRNFCLSDPRHIKLNKRPNCIRSNFRIASDRWQVTKQSNWIKQEPRNTCGNQIPRRATQRQQTRTASSRHQILDLDLCTSTSYGRGGSREEAEIPSESPGFLAKEIERRGEQACLVSHLPGRTVAAASGGWRSMAFEILGFESGLTEEEVLPRVRMWVRIWRRERDGWGSGGGAGLREAKSPESEFMKGQISSEEDSESKFEPH